MLADVTTASETGEDRTIATVLNDAMFEEPGQAQCKKSTKGKYSLLTRYTGSEAATIVRSVTGLDAWSILRAKYSRRTLGRTYRAQRECMYPKAAKDASQAKVAMTQWEEKWKKMMTELGRDAQIPDLRGTSPLLEMCL